MEELVYCFPTFLIRSTWRRRVVHVIHVTHSFSIHFATAVVHRPINVCKVVATLCTLCFMRLASTGAWVAAFLPSPLPMERSLFAPFLHVVSFVTCTTCVVVDSLGGWLPRVVRTGPWFQMDRVDAPFNGFWSSFSKGGMASFSKGGMCLGLGFLAKGWKKRPQRD